MGISLTKNRNVLVVVFFGLLRDASKLPRNAAMLYRFARKLVMCDAHHGSGLLNGADGTTGTHPNDNVDTKEVKQMPPQIRKTDFARRT